MNKAILLPIVLMFLNSMVAQESKKDSIPTIKVSEKSEDELAQDGLPDIITPEKIETNADDNKPVLRAEVYPIMPGSDVGINRDPKIREFIKNNIDWDKIPDGTSGNIYMSFIVEIDGTITNILILRGINDSTNNACIEVIKKIPRLTPATINDKPVRFKFAFPIRIKR